MEQDARHFSSLSANCVWKPKGGHKRKAGSLRTINWLQRLSATSLPLTIAIAHLLNSLHNRALMSSATAPTLIATSSLPNLSLKRRASSPLDPVVESSRKRLKESTDDRDQGDTPEYSRFTEELAQELQCGCCTELIYKPVLVLPCQHFFCGR